MSRREWIDRMLTGCELDLAARIALLDGLIESSSSDELRAWLARSELEEDLRERLLKFLKKMDDSPQMFM